MKILHLIKRIFRIIFRNIIIDKSGKINKLTTNNIIMSFNIRADHPRDIEHNWIHRKEAILKMIEDIKPAIICMQEVQPHMFKYLVNALSNTYGNISRMRTSSKEINKSFKWFEGGLVIFYDKSKYDVVNCKLHTFLGTNGKLHPFNYLDALFLDKDETCMKLVINNHMSLTKNIRERDIEILKTILYNNSYLAYACGDFNCSSKSAEFKSLNEYYITSDRERTFNHFDDTYAIIDYIISNTKISGYKVINQNYGVPYISDHYPIIVNL